MRSKLSIIRVCCLRRESLRRSEGMVTWLKLMKLNFSSESTRRLALPLSLDQSSNTLSRVAKFLIRSWLQPMSRSSFAYQLVFSSHLGWSLERRPMRGAALIKIISNNELLLLLLRAISQAITWHGSTYEVTVLENDSNLGEMMVDLPFPNEQIVFQTLGNQVSITKQSKVISHRESY